MPAKSKLIQGQEKLIDEQRYVEALRDIKHILDGAGVKYWLDFGTLLGAVRDGKFIPWDSDIDLVTMCTESHKIIAKIPEMEQKGFVVEMTDSSISIWKGAVLIDIILFRLKEGSAWRPWSQKRANFYRLTRYLYLLAEAIPYRNLPSRRKKRPRVKIAFALIPSFADHALRKFSFRLYEWLGGKYCALVVPKSYFENLDSISFYGMTFNVPSHIHDYLSLYYGEYWMNPDPNWAYYQYPALDYSFDMGKREDLSIWRYLQELKK